MTYHKIDECKKSQKEKGVWRDPATGFPLRCEIWSDYENSGEYSCPACGDVFHLHQEGPLPDGVENR